MKKFKKLAYIILFSIILVLIFALYVNATKDDEQTQKQKILTEIKLIESKLVNMCNTMNNISFENYKLEISTEEVKKPSQSGESSSGKGEGGSSGGESGEKSDSGSQGGSSSESGSGAGGESPSSTKEEVKKYELISQNVLTASEDINWDSVKSEVETLYISIPSITLDLYQANLNQEDILEFNRQYDNLTKVVKDENKKETLVQLVTLYDYIPKFLKNVSEDNLYQICIQTKAQILKAYAKLDDKDWSGIRNDVQSSIDIFNQLITSTRIDTSKQYSVNKVYIMVNELQNAVNMQDESVFLIKYKNLMEELTNM